MRRFDYDYDFNVDDDVTIWCNFSFLFFFPFQDIIFFDGPPNQPLPDTQFFFFFLLLLSNSRLCYVFLFSIFILLYSRIHWTQKSPKWKIINKVGSISPKNWKNVWCEFFSFNFFFAFFGKNNVCALVKQLSILMCIFFGIFWSKKTQTVIHAYIKCFFWFDMVK